MNRREERYTILLITIYIPYYQMVQAERKTTSAHIHQDALAKLIVYYCDRNSPGYVKNIQNVGN